MLKLNTKVLLLFLLIIFLLISKAKCADTAGFHSSVDQIDSTSTGVVDTENQPVFAEDKIKKSANEFLGFMNKGVIKNFPSLFKMVQDFFSANAPLRPLEFEKREISHKFVKLHKGNDLRDYTDYDDENIFQFGTYFSTIELINKRGYDAEEYKVTTEDGYQLNLIRIVKDNMEPGRPAVYLQHGVLAASDQWVLRGRKTSLPFILFEKNYDVYLGDQRGNANSESHDTYDVNEEMFWRFSFHESAIYDLPAFIKSILKISKVDEIYYIGHSMGTLVYLAMACQKPEVAGKIRHAILLAPIYEPPKKHRIKIKFLVIVSNLIRWYQHTHKMHYFLKRDIKQQTMMQEKCGPGVWQPFCYYLIGFVYGKHKDNLDKNLSGFYLSSAPAGTSLRTFEHLLQVFDSGKFRMFNYGNKVNKIVYGTKEPPMYNLTEINVPTDLIYGENDIFLSTKTIKKLNKLIRKSKVHKISFKEFTHFDYIFGLNAQEYVYDRVLNILHSDREKDDEGNERLPVMEQGLDMTRYNYFDSVFTLFLRMFMIN